MKKVLGFIYKIFGLIIFTCVAAGTIDYYRVKNNEFPLFTVSSFDIKTGKQSFQGPFYKITRIVSISKDESIGMSKKVKFTAILYNIPLEQNPIENANDLIVNTEEEKECTTSKLYFYNENIKVYTYCLTNIDLIVENKKDTLSNSLKANPELIDKLTDRLYVSNTYPDGSIKYVDTIEARLSNNGLSLIRCNKDGNKDIYIGPNNMPYNEDFCINKNDIEVLNPSPEVVE